MKSSLRVALFSSEYPPHTFGGLGTHVGEITATLAGRVAFEVFVPAEDDYVHRHPAIRFHGVPMSAARNNLELWLQYCSAAIRAAEQVSLRADLIHCHDWMTVLAGIKLREKLGKPLVYNVHLPQAQESYQILETLGLVCADLVLVNSLAVEREIRARSLPVQRIEIVPNGVDGETFSPGCDWPADDGYVLFIGRLVPQKGAALLLHAFSVVIHRYPESRLVIAGDGELELFLKRVTRYLGISHRVSFVSWQTGRELVEVYRRAQFAVIPSYYEPFGLVALEAMACGRPVIASRTGGLKEIIIDGVNGYLVPIGDHLQLAQRMVKLIGDAEHRRSMGEAARGRAAEFSWNKASAQTLNLYASLTGKQIEPLSCRLSPELKKALLSKLDAPVHRIVNSFLN